MPHNEITKFQLLAAIIREDRAYRELEGAEAFGDVLIEILRRMHSWNDRKFDAPDVIDVIFDVIAEEFRYAISEWDEHGSDIDSAPAEPTNRDVLEAIQDTIDVAKKSTSLVLNDHGNDLPPELDIPDQH